MQIKGKVAVWADKAERKEGGKTVVWHNQPDCLGLETKAAPVCVSVLCVYCMCVCVITSGTWHDSFCEVDWLGEEQSPLLSIETIISLMEISEKEKGGSVDKIYCSLFVV